MTRIHETLEVGIPALSASKRLLASILVLALMGAFPTLSLIAEEAAPPPLAEAPATIGYVDMDAVSIVTRGPVDVRSILRSLSENTGLGLQMVPDVQGAVDVHLENVPLERALEAVLGPLGLGFEIVDGVIVTNRPGMVTRWFNFDYPVTERKGSGELQITAGIASGGEGEQQSNSVNENQSQISSSLVMSVWPDVMNSLTTLVFQGVEFMSKKEENSQAISLADGEGRVLLANPMASLVQVTAESERIQQVEGLIERLKQSLLRQVAIEVKILEVALDKDTQTGIDWNVLMGDDTQTSLHTFDSDENIGSEFFKLVFDNVDITGVIEAIAQSGDLRTVASPRVTTLNNQKAVVRIVREEVFYEAQVEPSIVSNGVGTEAVINYTARTLPVGVVLDVTPQVGSDRIITLNVHPTISDVVAIVKSPNEDMAPVLSIRELDTVGRVRHGETLVLAGLISERTNHTKSGIPILKDLPLLGYIFGKTRKQVHNIELVIMLTPIILEDGR